MARSWYSVQASPRSTKSFVTVFFAAPVMRTVARMELPSTSEPMIWARLSVVSLFPVGQKSQVTSRSRGGSPAP